MPQHSVPSTRARRGARSVRDQARRSWSQNFLRDPSSLRAIVRAAACDPDGLVLEVGAGQGFLTAELARRCGSVLAYEIDPRLAAGLRERFAGDDRVRCVRGDFLAAEPPAAPFAVVGNIPYSISTPIVRWCLNACGLRSATLLAQWEFARKCSGDYRRWTLLTVASWPWFDWRLLGRVGREKFRPVPRCDSGILRLDRRERCLLPPHTVPDYRRFAELGYSGVGGSLHASLARRYPARRVAAALGEAGLTSENRAGDASPEQWITLFRLLRPASRSTGRTGSRRDLSSPPDGG